MSTLEAEQKLGKYTIVRELGRGGFATVYLAQDTVLRRSVALKILHPALLADPIFVQRFEQEAHATAQLDHPYIATIFDLGQLDGRLYIAMRLLSGGTLAERIKQHGPLSFAESVKVVEEVAAALENAHAAGFVHRDVKPTNILFDARGAAVLADFGMVKAVESSVIARTTVGAVVGTPAYIAPEVWENGESSPATDVYALGCVLFEMLTGELLFKGSTPPAVMLAHFRPHEYPARWPAGVPPEIGAVLNRALERSPADRYTSAGGLAAALRELLSGPTDALAKPYQALQAALAAQEWARAVQLAQEITARDPGYRDVPALAQQAIEAQARFEQAREVAQWRDAALEAERSGQSDAARAAARRWLVLAPGDAEAQALLERLSAADRSVETVPHGHESRLRDVEQQLPQQDVRNATSRSQVAPQTAQPTPASGRDTTAMPQIWTATALTIVTWTLSQVFYEYIGIVGKTRSAYEVGSFLGGGIGGFCLGYISCLIAAEIRAKHILLIAAGWAAAGLVRLEVGISLSQGDPNALLPWLIAEAVQCLIGGIITALVLRRAMPTLHSRVMYLLPIGWGTGFILGSLAFTAIGGPYEPTPRTLIFVAIDAAISGAIGGGVMFWAISPTRPREARNEH